LCLLSCAEYTRFYTFLKPTTLPIASSLLMHSASQMSLFISQVERLDDDWARLLPALASALASLPPRQRALAHVLEKAPTEAGAVQVLPHWREFGTETTTSTSSSSDSSSSTIPPNNPRTSTDSSNPILAVGTAFKEDGNRMASEKSKSTSSGLEYVPPFHDHPAEHFNNFHVLLVCRRYIQVL